MLLGCVLRRSAAARTMGRAEWRDGAAHRGRAPAAGRAGYRARWPQLGRARAHQGAIARRGYPIAVKLERTFPDR